MNKPSSILKRLTGAVLIGAMLLPLTVLSGCASKRGPKKETESIFALPSKKDEPKPKKPIKDPSTPRTMGEAMMQPRNDVL